MKNREMKKRPSAQKGRTFNSKNKRISINQDPFFDAEEKGSKRRRKMEEDNDEDIESSSGEDEEDDGDEGGGFGSGRKGGEGEEDEEEEEETAGEMKLRLSKDLLKLMTEAEKEEQEEEEEGSGDDEKRRVEREGQRDSRVLKILQQQQLEESGRLRRAIASRVQKPETSDGFRVLVKHRQSVTAVALSEDDLRGFSASKDGSILHWDVDSGKTEKYTWPTDEVLKAHGAKDPQGQATKHSKHVLALAVSSDGRYLASGGLDRHVHLWDIRTRQHLQAFPGHKGPVSCLTFRQGTSELFSGSFDRAVKIWNVEDRAYISTLFGHQSEVVTIDCLRVERVLTVGRDRTMHLWKVPEETQLIFRAPASSLECCCFISNQEFLSGSDDGSIEHWNVLRKKPVHIVKNAHALVSSSQFEPENGGLPNGYIENGDQSPQNLSPLARSWISSICICRSSDLAASGAGNGSVHLWTIQSESHGISPLFQLPLVGFVNSLAFAKSGRFLVAGVGQEPRLGRWDRIPVARNGVAVHSLKLS
ncbi:U3 snoRNP-associated protein-like EMB2271 [Coffea arabica]|uniref:U3 snoRNP-associated protein-like EMB2271 n=1 Tax=Coffea arabica TaxID=13443 RepID=A0A6P6U714_COFAR